MGEWRVGEGELEMRIEDTRVRKPRDTISGDD